MAGKLATVTTSMTSTAVFPTAVSPTHSAMSLIHTDAVRIRVGVNAIIAGDPASSVWHPQVMCPMACSAFDHWRPIGYWRSSDIGRWSGTRYTFAPETATAAQGPENHC